MPLTKHAQRVGQLSFDCFVFQFLFLPESYSRGLKIKNSAAIKNSVSEVGGDFQREIQITSHKEGWV